MKILRDTRSDPDHATDDHRLGIALVTETYPPEINGVALTVAQLVAGLRAHGHRLQLIRPRQRNSAPPERADRFEEILLAGLPIPLYSHLNMGLPAAGKLMELWRHNRPDVVHIATEGPLGWSALRAAGRLGIPVCTEFRTNFHAYSSHYGIGWLKGPILRYLRSFHARAFCTMVPTQGQLDQLEHLGFTHLQVVARGVDTERFDPRWRSDDLRKRWGAGSDTRVVLHTGRIAPEKNLPLLFTAFDAMRRIDPDMILVLVGDGPLRKDLEQRYPDTIFAGLQTGNALSAHYASADVFVFPSITETFGNVIPEAMASGLAVLGYDYAAAGQLIQSGVNGRLARYDHPEHFLQQAELLAAERAATLTCRSAARATACGLDWCRIVAQVECIYRAASEVSAWANEPDRALTALPTSRQVPVFDGER